MVRTDLLGPVGVVKVEAFDGVRSVPSFGVLDSWKKHGDGDENENDVTIHSSDYRLRTHK